MSIENVQQFYQVVLQDSVLQQQFQFAADEESLVHMAVQLGQQHGYDFTSEEVMQAIALAQSSTETTGMVELADEQLEAVAGGKGPAETILGGVGALPGIVGGGVFGITVGGIYAAVTGADYGETIKWSAETTGGLTGGLPAYVGSKIDETGVPQAIVRSHPISAIGY